MGEGTRALRKAVIHLGPACNRTDWKIAAAQTLGEGHDIRRDAFIGTGEKRARAIRAAHHFVTDQKHAIAVADLADALEITRHRCHRARGRTDHGLGHEGRDSLWPQPQDLGLERVSGAVPKGFGGLVRLGVAVVEAGHDLRALWQHRRIGRATGFAAGSRQRAQRIAVIALTARYHHMAPGLPTLDLALARHLDCRLHRLGPRAHEIDPRHAKPGDLADMGRQIFGRLTGEGPAMGIVELGDLP